MDGRLEMSSYKVVNKGEFTIVTYRQKDMLQVNQREFGILNQSNMVGFMKPRWEVANEMSYYAPNTISIKKYLSKDCTLTKLYGVFARIVFGMKQVLDNQMSMQNLLLDSKYVFVREGSNEIFFVYEPYLKNSQPTNVLTFFLSIISMVKIKDKGQKIQLEQFRQYVSTHGNLDELGNYVNQQLNMQNMQGTPVRNPATGSFQNPPSRSMSLHAPMEEEGTTVLGYEEDEGTTVLNAQMDFEPETTVLRREPNVFLVRSKDGSKTQLVGEKFTIGRSADNYIAIRDNTDVSRHHAAIIKRNDMYCITDGGSKNGTTLNGNNVSTDVAESLQDSDVLVFGGEEFTFVVEE